MKSVDPTIQLGAVIYPIDEEYNDWTAQVLPEVENDADFLVVMIMLGRLMRIISHTTR